MIVYNKKKFLFTSIILSLLSCSRDNMDISDVEMTDVRIRMYSESQVESRSSFSFSKKDGGDSMVNDIQLVITQGDDDALYDVVYSDINKALSFKAVKGQKYKIWAAANMGGQINVRSITDFTAQRKVDFSTIDKNGVPMFSNGYIEYTAGTDDPSIDIELCRMLARVDISIDRSRLAHFGNFTVKNVRIYNAINSFTPFESNIMQKRQGVIDYGFDYASADDLAAINGGETISLYAFENMQGTILQGNTDPWKKVPGNIAGAADYCSYLELECSCSGQGLSSESVQYRLYLGRNSYDNFDVCRNTVYSLVIQPSEDEIFGKRGSWKVSSTGWSDKRSLRLDRNSVTVEALSSETIMILKSPADLDCSLASNGFDQVGLSMERKGNEIKVISTKDLDKTMTASLVLSSWDGLLTDDCLITINPKVTEDHSETIYENIDFTLSPCSDVPACGGWSGPCTVGQVSCDRFTRTWMSNGEKKDGQVQHVTLDKSQYQVFFSTTENGSYSTTCPSYQGFNLGTTTIGRKSLGSIWAYIKIVGGEESGRKSIKVYQEENCIVNTQKNGRTSNPREYSEKNYGSITTEAIEDSYGVSVSAENYFRPESPAPASGASVTLTCNAWHYVHKYQNWTMQWTDSDTISYYDLYSSGEGEQWSKKVETGRGVEEGADDLGIEKLEDSYVYEAVVTDFPRQGDTITIPNERDTVTPQGRQATFVVSNENKREVRTSITIYQEPNLDTFIPEHYENKNYTLLLDSHNIGAQGGEINISVSVERRFVGNWHYYTSGFSTGADGDWNIYTSVLYNPEEIIIIDGEDVLEYVNNYKSLTDGYDKIIVPANNGAAREWTLKGIFEGVSSNEVKITQSGSQ